MDSGKKRDERHKLPRKPRPKSNIQLQFVFSFSFSLLYKCRNRQGTYRTFYCNESYFTCQQNPTRKRDFRGINHKKAREIRGLSYTIRSDYLTLRSKYAWGCAHTGQTLGAFLPTYSWPQFLQTQRTSSWSTKTVSSSTAARNLLYLSS